jgi:hypothetical protein
MLGRITRKHTWRKRLMDIVIEVEGEAELLPVVAALDPPRRLTGRLNGRQQQGDQDANDGDHHEQLDERESPPITTSHVGFPISSSRQINEAMFDEESLQS